MVIRLEHEVDERLSQNDADFTMFCLFKELSYPHLNRGLHAFRNGCAYRFLVFKHVIDILKQHHILRSTGFTQPDSAQPAY